MDAHGFVLAAPRARLALLRGRLDEVERLLPALEHSMMWCALQAAAARLDALAALGERERVEAEAQLPGRTATYLAPFALRALGIVREDEGLLSEAGWLGSRRCSSADTHSRRGAYSLSRRRRRVKA